MSAASREALHEVVAGSLLSRHSGVASRRDFRRAVPKRTGKTCSATRLSHGQPPVQPARQILARRMLRGALAAVDAAADAAGQFCRSVESPGTGTLRRQRHAPPFGGAIDTLQPAAALPR